jgi:hypothetical protein
VSGQEPGDNGLEIFLGVMREQGVELGSVAAEFTVLVADLVQRDEHPLTGLADCSGPKIVDPVVGRIRCGRCLISSSPRRPSRTVWPGREG